MASALVYAALPRQGPRAELQIKGPLLPEAESFLISTLTPLINVYYTGQDTCRHSTRDTFTALFIYYYAEAALIHMHRTQKHYSNYVAKRTITSRKLFCHGQQRNQQNASRYAS